MLLFRLIPLFFLAGVIGLVHAAVNDFMHRDLNGVEHRLQDYKGKWIVVNYWATWCSPCVEEIPALVDFHSKHQHKDAVVVGVNMEEIDDQSVKNFLGDFKVNYPVLLAEPSRNTELGEIVALPTTFIVSPQGEVVKRVIGKVSIAEIERLIGGKAPGKIKR